MFICTERLFLRPGWAEDEAELTRAIGHADDTPVLASMPWPRGEAKARAFLSRDHDAPLPRLLVTLPDEGGRIVGGCSLHRPHRDAAGVPAWVECWITPSCRGRGYAREALAGLIATAHMLGHTRLRARHALDDPASGKVLRSCGFRPSGRVTRLDSAARGGALECSEYELELAATAPTEDRRPGWACVQAYAAAIDAAA